MNFYVPQINKSKSYLKSFPVNYQFLKDSNNIPYYNLLFITKFLRSIHFFRGTRLLDRILLYWLEQSMEVEALVIGLLKAQCCWELKAMIAKSFERIHRSNLVGWVLFRFVSSLAKMQTHLA